MAFVRLVVIGFFFLSIIYVMVSIYSRSVRREKLEKQWDAEHPDGSPSERETFVEAGMEHYRSSYRPKLILLVYVVPVIVVAAIHIMTTYY